MPDTVQRSGSGTCLPIDIRTFPWIKKLARDYAFAPDALAPFFSGHPTRPADWDAVIARVLARTCPRLEMGRVIARQLEGRQAPPAAREAAARLAHADTVAVVTGQQAGLFGGPFFTLLKAITAVKLARTVEAEHGTPAVPVFWVEAEDHDWDEVAACAVWDGDLQRQVVTLAPPPGAGQRPVASVTLSDAAGDALTQLRTVLPETEYRDPVVDGLQAAYRPGHGMAEAFARWLDAQLGPSGLVVFEGSDPAAKPLASHVFVRELEHPGRTAQLAADAGRALEALGYHAQVEPPDGPALFYLDGQRTAIRRDGTGYRIDASAREVRDLAQEAGREPARFSPSVLLRPIVQDTLFPTVCYVPGPSELAYLAQLGDVYAQFALPMPLLHPRGSVTLLDSGAARFLARYDVPFDALHAQDDRLLNELLAAQIPPEVDGTFSETEGLVAQQMDRLADVVRTVDPTLEGAARSVAGKMRHDLEVFHGKLIQAAKRRDATLRRQFERARAQAFPSGQPQERSVSAAAVLARYGPALLARLLEDLPLDPGRHWLMVP